jgi:hypothetical protein
MELVNFRNQSEAEGFVELFVKNSKSDMSYVDGMINTLVRGEWLHFGNGERLPVNFPWFRTQPDSRPAEHCINIEMGARKGFHDYNCFDPKSFVCQDVVPI